MSRRTFAPPLRVLLSAGLACALTVGWAGGVATRDRGVVGVRAPDPAGAGSRAHPAVGWVDVVETGEAGRRLGVGSTDGPEPGRAWSGAPVPAIKFPPKGATRGRPGAGAAPTGPRLLGLLAAPANAPPIS